MKKFIVIILLIGIFFFNGCAKVDENGFYLEGNLKNHHKETKSKYDSYGYDINGIDKKGYNKNGFDIFDFDKKGIHKITKTRYDEKGFDKKGYNKNGFDVNGIDKKGYNKNGFDIFDFDKKGIHKITKTRYDKKGFDINGIDKKGYNRNGFDRNGIHKITKTRYDENDYDCNGKKFVSAFEEKKFIDNFGDPTDDKYILQKIEGVFSNSATDNSPAYISLIYNGGNSLRFDMHNYNRGSKAYFSSYGYFKYKLKDDAGNILNGKMDISTNLKGCLTIYRSEVIEMVKTAQFIKVYIYEVNGDTKYNFTINCSGFCRSITYLNE